MSRIVDLSQPIETGQPVYPGLAKTLINTWNTIDIDPTYPAHVLAKELDYYHMENLTNSDQLVGKRFQFAGFPLKLVGASGAPMGAVAILAD
ncbi:MAG: hypothetical protein HY892_00945 [Deltaproteobacteria bacterium]|nr:hypothetical protein [Deltaproteobacteria bacterium]